MSKGVPPNSKTTTERLEDVIGRYETDTVTMKVRLKKLRENILRESNMMDSNRPHLLGDGTFTNAAGLLVSPYEVLQRLDRYHHFLHDIFSEISNIITKTE
jgi:hypothetical protein